MNTIMFLHKPVLGKLIKLCYPKKSSWWEEKLSSSSGVNMYGHQMGNGGSFSPTDPHSLPFASIFT